MGVLSASVAPDKDEKSAAPDVKRGPRTLKVVENRLLLTASAGQANDKAGMRAFDYVRRQPYLAEAPEEVINTTARIPVGVPTVGRFQVQWPRRARHHDLIQFHLPALPYDKRDKVLGVKAMKKKSKKNGAKKTASRLGHYDDGSVVRPNYGPDSVPSRHYGTTRVMSECGWVTVLPDVDDQVGGGGGWGGGQRGSPFLPPALPYPRAGPRRREQTKEEKGIQAARPRRRSQPRHREPRSRGRGRSRTRGKGHGPTCRGGRPGRGQARDGALPSPSVPARARGQGFRRPEPGPPRPPARRGRRVGAAQPAASRHADHLHAPARPAHHAGPTARAGRHPGRRQGRQGHGSRVGPCLRPGPLGPPVPHAWLPPLARGLGQAAQGQEGPRACRARAVCRLHLLRVRGERSEPWRGQGPPPPCPPHAAQSKLPSPPSGRAGQAPGRAALFASPPAAAAPAPAPPPPPHPTPPHPTPTHPPTCTVTRPPSGGGSSPGPADRAVLERPHPHSSQVPRDRARHCTAEGMLCGKEGEQVAPDVPS